MTACPSIHPSLLFPFTSDIATPNLLIIKQKEFSTRRTLHAGVSTIKGANEELFVLTV